MVSVAPAALAVWVELAEQAGLVVWVGQVVLVAQAASVVWVVLEESGVLVVLVVSVVQVATNGNTIPNIVAVLPTKIELLQTVSAAQRAEILFPNGSPVPGNK